jgi:hypothetical protein
MSKPNVFIIESLKFDDEKNKRLEGDFLSHILRLTDKAPGYYYIRTRKEMEKVLALFRESGYRYLHISCHGSSNKISTTLDEISFSDLGKMINPYLKNKRLFLSACSSVNQKLAKAIIPESKCYSIIGPKKDVFFQDAAIMWASFYHLMFKENPDAMSRKDILPILKRIARTFKMPLNYFSISKNSPQRYKGNIITIEGSSKTMKVSA